MGFEYSVINSQWSAISAYYNYVDNRTVRQQPKVSALMPADFHVKPAKPKYVLFAMWGKFFFIFSILFPGRWTSDRVLVETYNITLSYVSMWRS